MNKLMSFLAITATTAMLAVEAAAETDPLSVVQSLVGAMTAQDVTATQAVFTEDAGYAYSLDGVLNRGDGFDGWLTSDITGPASLFEIETATVTGNTVDALVLWGRGGNTSSEARYVFTVVDGQIDSWRMVGR